MRILEILTTAFLAFETIFFVFHAWKVRKNYYHLFGNAISGIFSALSIILIWR